MAAMTELGHGRAPGNLGAWESSGIVDASEPSCRGAFLIERPGTPALDRKGAR
jgi:hypothetical protein